MPGEDEILNPFLNTFGLGILGEDNSLIDSFISVTSPHPIFDKVDTLRFDNGNSIVNLQTNADVSILESVGNSHLYAVVDPDITAVNDYIDNGSLPLKNSPNPFSDFTTIAFELHEPASVNLTVYNQMGQQVKRLINDRMLSGSSEIQWSGKDDTGSRLPDGLYLCQLKVSNRITTLKLVLFTP